MREYNPLTSQVSTNVKGSKVTMCGISTYKLQVKTVMGRDVSKQRLIPEIPRKNQDLFIYIFGGGILPLQTEEITLHKVYNFEPVVTLCFR